MRVLCTQPLNCASYTLLAVMNNVKIEDLLYRELVHTDKLLLCSCSQFALGKAFKTENQFSSLFFLIEPYRYIEGVQKKPQILMAQKAVKFFVRIFSHSYGNENQWFCVVFN